MSKAPLNCAKNLSLSRLGITCNPSTTVLTIKININSQFSILGAIIQVLLIFNLEFLFY